VEDQENKKIKGREMGGKEAKKALREILNARMDLAITTLFNDESRFYLSKHGGPDFAQKVDLSNFDMERGGKSVLEFAIRQRIDRV